MSSVSDDIREVFQKMPEAFRPEKVGDTNAIIQLDLTGEGGGQWSVKIANGQLSVDEGQADASNLTLSMPATDYLALTRGEANPTSLFMAGKIKLQGDMGLAMKFQDMFDRG